MTLEIESLTTVTMRPAVSSTKTRRTDSARRRDAMTDIPKRRIRSPRGYPILNTSSVKSAASVDTSGASRADQSSIKPPRKTVATSSQNCRASARDRRKRGKERRPKSRGG